MIHRVFVHMTTFLSSLTQTCHKDPLDLTKQLF